MCQKRFNITATIYDRKGNVLAIGQNSYVKTHPLQAKHAAKVGEAYKVYMHAEVHAITRCKDLSKAHRIFISRYNENGTTATAKPCKICQSAITATNIQIIEHT